MFDVVFINSTADFQKLLHNHVSSLVGNDESLAFEIPMVTYCFVYFLFYRIVQRFRRVVGSNLISIVGLLE